MKSDKDLQHDVIAELSWSPSLQNEEIGVAVKNGVVTLSGTVSNYVKKFEAERAAESVHGVKAVAINLIVKLPNEWKRTDTEIAHAALDALKWDVRVPDDKIRLRVEEGRIILEGEVEWQYQRDAAARAVRNLTGVITVSNFLTLKPKKVSSADVSRKIKEAFKRSAEVDSSNISVDSLDGKIILKGHVRSWAERRDAENAAWSAPGVQAVDDRLAVSL